MVHVDIQQAGHWWPNPSRDILVHSTCWSYITVPNVGGAQYRHTYMQIYSYVVMLMLMLILYEVVVQDSTKQENLIG